MLSPPFNRFSSSWPIRANLPHFSIYFSMEEDEEASHLFPFITQICATQSRRWFSAEQTQIYQAVARIYFQLLLGGIF